MARKFKTLLPKSAQRPNPVSFSGTPEPLQDGYLQDGHLQDGYLQEGQPQKEQEAETGGRGGLDPVRYGDWEVNGRCVDF